MRKNREFILGIFVLFTFLWFLAISPCVSTVVAETITLKVATIMAPPPNSQPGEGLKLWMDKVTEKTNGKVKFQVFWGASLAPPKAHNDLVEKGMVDLAQSCRGYTPGTFPLGQFEYVFPMGPEDMALVTKAKRQVYEEIPAFRENLSKHNALLIMNTPTSPYNFMSRMPIAKLEDFKGKKVGVFGRYLGRWLKPLQAVPVVSTMHDRYQMLQTGVIDLSILPYDTFYTTKTYEVAPYYIGVNCFVGVPHDLMANTKKFKKLPTDIQKALLEAGKETELAFAPEIHPRWKKKVFDTFKQRQIKVNYVSDEERKKWAESIPDIPAQWAAEVSAKGFPGWEIVKRYQEITTELGYEWPRKWGIKK